ncbi:DUF6377 domain-containing protein [Flammeovirga sp. SubArs3]|uniref:DUF6377 domain-containing protein n=1 Tax=Flammeovirga sp. SubArs3 TaxID=2995316 RepID=UPI00248BBEFC|nr:DUF6377 domain-containing protein [Flammeovirga sp. SubArs3]
MKRIFLLLLSLFISFDFFAAPLEDVQLDSLYSLLDQIIAERESYSIEKNRKIDQFRVVLETDSTSTRNKYFLATEIYNQYLVFEFYGALHFAYEAIKFAQELNEPELIHESQLNLAQVLVIAGIYQESSEILDKLNPKKLSTHLLHKYYVIRKDLYNQLYFYSPTKKIKEGYKEAYTNYCDSILMHVPENSEEFLHIRETRALDNRDLQLALSINSKRIARTELGHKLYATVAFERSLVYEIEEKINLQKKYLILSAISDLKAAVKDNASLATLAFLLYHENDIERAYKYINISYEDALFYNSKLRAIQIANILPVISKSYEVQLREQKSRLQHFNIIITIMTIVLVIGLFFIYRQVKSIREARNITITTNNKLRDSNKELVDANEQLNQLHTDLSTTNMVKEVYIGEFLKICSDYIDKLEHQSLHTQKMLIKRKYGELLTEIKNSDVRKMEMKLFYKNFDETFLHIYPSFVESFNKLLDKDQPIVTKNKNSLTTELRIFALVRLGINDSNKIAKLLGNSVTTIYNYRVKIKNKASVDREKFDDYVMKIGEFNKNIEN